MLRPHGLSNNKQMIREKETYLVRYVSRSQAQSCSGSISQGDGHARRGNLDLVSLLEEALEARMRTRLSGAVTSVSLSPGIKEAQLLHCQKNFG
jgi:hypothetical protein